jgi:ribosomal protein S19E (S16A)
MPYHPAKRPPAKGPELTDKEMAGLRDVANQRAVEASLLERLNKIGLVEQKSGAWTTTQKGHITLMFASAR